MPVSGPDSVYLCPTHGGPAEDSATCGYYGCTKAPVVYVPEAEVERLREAAQYLLDHPRSAKARLAVERAIHGDGLALAMARRLNAS